MPVKKRECVHFSTCMTPILIRAIVFQQIAELNADNSVHGILVQLPLPKHFDAEEFRGNFTGQGCGRISR